MSHPYAKTSELLKAKCLVYLVANLSEELESYLENNDFYKKVPIDAKDSDAKLIREVDNFLLFGKTFDGERVLSQIMEKDNSLNNKERSILKEWEENAFNSIFEILNKNEDHLILLDLFADVEYTVYPNDEDFPFMELEEFEPHRFIGTNLAPINGIWFLSGAQTSIQKKSIGKVAKAIHETIDPQAMYRNNPKKLKHAFELQKQDYDRFVKHFGTDEVMIRGSELVQKEQSYYETLFPDKKIPSSLGFPHFPPELLESDDLCIFMDEKEGRHYFMGYKEFKNVFSEFFTKPEDWDEPVMAYLEDETIPAVLFQRMKDQYPDRFKTVIRYVVPGWEDRDPIGEFEALMDEYKPGWRTPYPSVHPINERLKKYMPQSDSDAIGRNDPCPCGAKQNDGTPIKFKKCCGQ